MNLKNLEDAAQLARKLDMIATMRREYRTRNKLLLRSVDPSEFFRTGERGLAITVEWEDMEGFLTTLELKYRAELRRLGVDA